MGYSEKVQTELANAQQTAIANKIIDMLQKLELSNDETTVCRWVWELIQNAKDVANDSGKVDIKIDFDEKKQRLVFSHNGKYFTTKNLVYLISQVSSKERENTDVKKTTGKFGTGFLTTHLLSEKVTIEGLWQDPGEKIKKINVLLDRSGDVKEEIMNSVGNSFMQLESSEEIIMPAEIDINGYNTKFTYHLDNEGIKTAQKGLESLYISAPYVLAFVDEINSIQINGTLSFKKGQMDNDNDITLHKIVIEKDGAISDIIVFTFLSGEITLAAPVEFKNGKMCFKSYLKGTSKLFCDFPLIGTEGFTFPVIINSSCFNPTEPRNGIFLTNKENKIIDENKKLMLQALEAYKRIIDYAEKYDWKQIYNIVTIHRQQSYDWLSNDWLQDNIIEKCKSYIKMAPIIDTENCEKKALDDWIDGLDIFIICDNEKELRERVWDLARYICPERLVLFSEIHKWCNSLWPECRNFNIIELIKIVESYRYLTILEKTLINEMNSITWLGQLYSAMELFMNQSELCACKVFPNQMGELCTLNELYYDNSIEEEYKDILTLMGVECREYLLDNRINTQIKQICQMYDYESLFNEIEVQLESDCANRRSALGKLIVLYEESTEDDQEQILLLELLDAIFEWEIPNECKVKKISESIMKKAKSFWSTILADAVSECKCMNGLENVLLLPETYTINQWMKELIDYLVQYKRNNLLERKTKPILPNQNGVFRTLESLFLDSGEIDDLFKDILLGSGDDIRENLLLSDIFLELPPSRTKLLKDISQSIVNYVKDNQGKVKNQEVEVIINFKSLYLWLIDHEDKAKKYFGVLLENKHWLYNDHEIADYMRKVEVYDDILKKYNIHDSKGLEELLVKYAKGNSHEVIDEMDITEEFLVQHGISSEVDFSKAADMKVFGSNFVHISESNADKFVFVNKILERSKNNIFRYLQKQEDYDLSDAIPVSNTIFLIKKYGKEILLITRPSDYGQVILYYDLEKDVLDYEKEWELWVEDGISTPEKITFGKMMKLTGINKIPLRRVR